MATGYRKSLTTRRTDGLTGAKILLFETSVRSDRVVSADVPSSISIRKTTMTGTPEKLASQLLLEALVQLWRRLALTTNAFFCARVSCFTTYSRASAFPTDRNAS
jgi:hypothetical protein